MKFTTILKPTGRFRYVEQTSTVMVSTGCEVTVRLRVRNLVYER